jgi:hypothetical protein
MGPPSSGTVSTQFFVVLVAETVTYAFFESIAKPRSCSSTGWAKSSPWHRPPVHVVPWPHAFPQTPQLLGSASVSAHAPEQQPTGHSTPHVPQLARSEARSAQ